MSDGYRCVCGFDRRPYTAARATEHKAHHLEVYPDVDRQTVANLDSAIAWAELREVTP